MGERTRTGLAVGLAALALLALGSLAVFEVISLVQRAEPCAPASRAALLQPASFDDVAVVPRPEFLDARDVCGTTFSTTALGSEVVEHYRGELLDLGWRVDVADAGELAEIASCDPDTRPRRASACPRLERLTAMNRDVCYSVLTEAYPPSRPEDSTVTQVYLSTAPCTGRSG